MFVALLGKNKLYKVNLPNVVNGSYWIIDENGKKLLKIEGNNEKWKIESNSNISILKNIDNNFGRQITQIDVVDSAILKEYEIKYIFNNRTKEKYVLYCAPTLENYIHLEMKDTSAISIGNAEGNDIIYRSFLAEDVHAKIFYSNNVLLIENYDTNFGTFVNNKPVKEERRFLFNGDVIFIMGLKIIIMGRHIFINNPLGKVKYNEQRFIENKKEVKVQPLKEEEDVEVEIYSETDYFTRPPRIKKMIECEKVNIDPPPQIEKNKGMPLGYIIASSLSMGIVSLIMMISSIDRLMSGEATLKNTAFSLAMSMAMLLSMILLPIINSKYEKREKIKYEKNRQSRYREYINSKIEVIDEIMEKQRKILFENYPEIYECIDIINTRSPRLWERKIQDEDFLEIRVGKGDIPLDVEIEYPKKRFAMEDDDLVDILNTLGNKSKILKDVPVTVSLVEKDIAALVVEKDERLKEKFIQNLIIQLIAFHSYEDLKLVFLLKDASKNNYEHMKMLPHLWDDSKQIRFFTDNYNEMEVISKYLEQELKNRQATEQDSNGKKYMPHYLIITDDFSKVENLEIVRDINKAQQNMGFSIFCISDNFTDLPSECKTFITIKGKEGKMFDNEISYQNQVDFMFDDTYIFLFEKISKEISNIPIKYNVSGQGALPSTYTFLEMYDVGNIEDLNINERWRENDTCISLKAPIGINPSGNLIYLDVHEKAHGPHGLIAGSTGSGKSEFIITYILSMAINYHPDDVAFVLIDYKGGGLAGAFQKRDIKLPHLVGTITNIDTIGLKRSLVSIQSELRKRQKLFNKARDLTEEGTIDIYKYQKLYHEGVVDRPIPHLLIICDEFAELKQQQEEFMDELISVARIGRSLGVHLILATQKPAGIVNDQIKSNSKFGICLKVQDSEDSRDVIKRPDAAELKKAGQFYMQVGNNEYFALGQSAWSGAPYFPTNLTKRKVDNLIEFISNIGIVIKQADNQKREKIKKKRRAINQYSEENI